MTLACDEPNSTLRACTAASRASPCATDIDRNNNRKEGRASSHRIHQRSCPQTASFGPRRRTAWQSAQRAAERCGMRRYVRSRCSWALLYHSRVLFPPGFSRTVTLFPSKEVRIRNNEAGPRARLRFHSTCLQAFSSGSRRCASTSSRCAAAHPWERPSPRECNRSSP